MALEFPLFVVWLIFSIAKPAAPPTDAAAAVPCCGKDEDDEADAAAPAEERAPAKEEDDKLAEAPTPSTAATRLSMSEDLKRRNVLYFFRTKFYGLFNSNKSRQ